MALVSFKAPALDKKGKLVTLEKKGFVAFLHVGPRREKFILQINDATNEPEVLSHYATGQKMPGTLSEIKIANMMARGHAARMSDRVAAQKLIDRAIAAVGVDRVRAVIDAAPILNA